MMSKNMINNEVCPMQREEDYSLVSKLLASVVYGGVYLSQSRDWYSMKFQSILNLLPKKIKITEVKEGLYKVKYQDIPEDLKIDFMQDRAPQYLPYFYTGARNFYDKYFYGWKNSEIYIPSDDFIIKILHNSQLSKSIKSNNDGSYSVRLKYLHEINNLLLTELPYEIESCTVYHNHYLEFKSIYGDIYTSFDKVAYDLAKIGFLSAAQTYLSHLEHPASHFHFTDIVCALTYNMQDDHSVLYKLLVPHTKYTLFLNDAVLENYHTPFASKEVIRGFFNNANPFISLDVDDESYTELLSKLNKDIFNKEDFFYVNCHAETNFCNQMHKYYGIVKNFVDDVSVYMCDVELANFQNDLLKYNIDVNNGSKDYNKEKVIDFITYFIFNVAFVHSIEHFTLWGSYYYQPNLNLNTVLDGSTPVTLGSFTKSIKSIVQAGDSIYDAMIPQSSEKFNNLAQFYVKYLRSKEKNYNMNEIDYQFEDSELQELNKNFISELVQYNEQLLDEQMVLIPLYMVSQSLSW